MILSALAPMKAAACSGAVISGKAAQDGRPILWKNRDTDHRYNKVVFVAEKPYSYLGVVNDDDPSGRRAWSGLNTEGFAVMNTVAYNLPSAKGEEYKDLEGGIMADALRTCRTVSDFEDYLKKNIGPALGSQADFGVIDAHGGASLFEVHNSSFTRFDAEAEAGKYLLITNFSRSGEKDKGKGYVRFSRLRELFTGVKSGKYSVAMVLERFARDLVNPMLAPAAVPGRGPSYIHAAHTIDRATTASAIVVRGVKEGESSRNSMMWFMPGEPACSVAVPLWPDSGEVPFEVGGGTRTQLNRETMRLKSLLRPFADDERAEYLDLARLVNKSGTGWLGILTGKEKEMLAETEGFISTDPSPARKAAFQRAMAAKALEQIGRIH